MAENLSHLKVASWQAPEDWSWVCCHWLRDSYLLRSFSTEGRQTGGREKTGDGVRGAATGDKGRDVGWGWGGRWRRRILERSTMTRSQMAQWNLLLCTLMQKLNKIWLKWCIYSVKLSVSLCQIKFQFIIQNIEVSSGRGLVCQCTLRAPSLHFPGHPLAYLQFLMVCVVLPPNRTYLLDFGTIVSISFLISHFYFINLFLSHAQRRYTDIHTTNKKVNI